MKSWLHKYLNLDALVQQEEEKPRQVVVRNRTGTRYIVRSNNGKLVVLDLEVDLGTYTYPLATFLSDFTPVVEINPFGAAL